MINNIIGSRLFLPATILHPRHSRREECCERCPLFIGQRDKHPRACVTIWPAQTNNLGGGTPCEGESAPEAKNAFEQHVGSASGVSAYGVTAPTASTPDALPIKSSAGSVAFGSSFVLFLLCPSSRRCGGPHRTPDQGSTGAPSAAVTAVFKSLGLSADATLGDDLSELLGCASPHPNRPTDGWDFTAGGIA